jgi:thioredoxin 1
MASALTREITGENLESTIETSDIVFLDFWASWCGPCRSFAPIYEQAAAKYPDIAWGKVDTDAQQELAATFDIRSIPTIMAFRGGIPVFSHSGVIPLAALDQLVTQIRGLDMDDVRRQYEESEDEDDDTEE